jgi:hypothetical protein
MSDETLKPRLIVVADVFAAAHPLVPQQLFSDRRLACTVGAMQSGLPVLASINPGNDLAGMIEREGVGRVCTDYSVDTLQRLALELVDEVLAAGARDQAISARCKALSAKLFSPEAAVKQIGAALKLGSDSN